MHVALQAAPAAGHAAPAAPDTPATTIVVDYRKQHVVDAGRCDKCGYYKTWAFTILNPKTGKQVPGHVTRDGYKVGDGDCPYWHAIAASRATRPSKLAQLITASLASGLQPALVEPGNAGRAGARGAPPRVLELDVPVHHPSMATTSSTSPSSSPPAPGNMHGLRLERVGSHVVVSLGGRVATFSTADAIKLAGAILDLVAKKP